MRQTYNVSDPFTAVRKLFDLMLNMKPKEGQQLSPQTPVRGAEG